MAPELLADLTHFPRFWFATAPAWWTRFFLRLLKHIDNQFAVTVMARLWLIPVWQDTTVIGRSLSLIFRTTRVTIGAVVLAIAVVGMLFWLCVWLLLPLLLLLYIPSALFFFLLLWVIDAAGSVIARQRDPVLLLEAKARADVANLHALLLAYPSTRLLLEMVEEETLPPLSVSIDYQELHQTSFQIQKHVNDRFLRPEHFLLALTKHLKFHPDAFIASYRWLQKKKTWANPPWIWQDTYPQRPIGGINRGWIGITTPQLDKVSSDFTRLAARGRFPELVDREAKMEEIVRTLGREGKENVMLVGEAGSGKTVLIEGLANEIVRGTPYESLRFKRLIALDVAAVGAGTPEKVKERMVTIIEEIRAAGNVILVIDEIHNLVTAQESQGASAVFAALEPHLDAGQFQCLATTTPKNYKLFIEPSGAFARTFRVVDLPPATVEESLAIVEWKAFEMESKHKATFTHAALREAVELSRRYVQDRVLPDSAIDLLEETITKYGGAGKRIGKREVEEMATEKTKIPLRTVDSREEKKLLLDLEKLLHERVIGQDEAIENVADALRRARAGLTEEGKLLASFLFVGATGVGKTETAKALAQVYFGSEKNMVRLDLSEYQTPESLNRLLGPPPGEPGFEAGGQLTEAVRHRPFTVVLLDEIEKANPKILDVFLQLLDDARLTDGSGRTVDFSSTIVIATSNIGTDILVEGATKNIPFEKLKAQVLEKLRRTVRPEFLNRFTSIAVYKPLEEEQVKHIAVMQLTRIQKNLEQKDIKLKIAPELVDELATRGFSPLWGAREMRRIIRDQVEEVLAKKILSGEIEPGKEYLLTPQFLSLPKRKA